MKNVLLSVFFLFFAIFLGCSSAISVTNTSIKPSTVDPGDNTLIIVELKGSITKVANVTATVREYPELTIPLNDNGESGDKKAGDNTWTFEMPVPWEAPAGTYHFDISVYDVSGNEVITKGFEQQTTGRSGSMELTIK